MEDPVNSAGGKLGEYAYRSRLEAAAGRDRSFAEIVKDIIADVQGIIRSEVRLAKAEVKEEVSKTSNAAIMMGAAGVMALYAGGFILLAAVYALTNVVPNWAAALIVGLVVGGVAALLLSMGRSRFKDVHAVPEKTIDSVKENVEWMKNQTRS